MSLLLSSQQAADEIRHRTGFKAHTRWIRTLCKTGLLRDHSMTRHARISAAELELLLIRHPRRTLPIDYLGVSLGPLVTNSPAFHRDPPWRLYRTHAGYNHHNAVSLSPTQRARAITSLWRIHDDLAQEIVDRELPLIGSVGGLVTPQMIYWPRAVIHLQGGIGFDVDPERFGHPAISTGALLDIPPGNAWRIVST
ncbi:hypothetical protein [Nocardia jejuensis]|uniref:hypothetical protein n=1 Tax=Nocardia jejuensis TaxID=328049 RepID=UPI0008296F1C|nr:hypothetical protein [Nocardia jejuensis]